MSDIFGFELATEIGQNLKTVDPNFSIETLVDAVVSPKFTGGWATQIAQALAEQLPAAYPDALEVLLAVLGPEQPWDRPLLDAYKFAPFASFVVHYGLDDFTASTQALYHIAKRSYVAQVAMRDFILRYRQQSLALLYTWTADPNGHIRCLVSGGTRPRLRLKAMPGLTKLMPFIEDPRPLLKLLAQLKEDPSPGVRRSVAGNLSDIIKDNPTMAYGTLNQWQKTATKPTLQIIRNALKYARGKGDQRALALFKKCGLSNQ